MPVMSRSGNIADALGASAMPSLRGCAVAVVLGGLFTFITLRLTLGSAGMTPPLTIPAGLLSYVLLKAVARLQPRSRPFTAQENAVAQTMATSCYKIVGFAGYGSYLTALSYPIYLQLGGVPKGQPGYDASAVVDPDLHRVYPYLLLIAFGGIFALLSLRELLIIKWRLPFPSGAASGAMINSLHDSAQGEPAAAGHTTSGLHHPYSAADTPAQTSAQNSADQPYSCHGPLSGGDGGNSNSSSNSDGCSSGNLSSLATRKVKVLAYTALGSFLFDAFKWLFQGPTYNCGFATWPTFGFAAAQWTWRFDFMQQYIGSGFLVPHIVAWSMLLGAILSWGIMWPLLAAREGDWFPAGLSFSDMRGLAGYKIFLSVSLLLGEGAFIMLKAALLGFQHLRTRRVLQHSRALAERSGQLRITTSSSSSDGSWGASSSKSHPHHHRPAQPQDLQPVVSSSSSCALHCSLAAAPSSDVRHRLACAAAYPLTCAQQQQQQTQQQQQQQSLLLQRLEEGTEPESCDDAAAVLVDDVTSSGEGGCGPATGLGKRLQPHGDSGPGSSGAACRQRRLQPQPPRHSSSGAAAAAAADDDDVSGGVAGAMFQESQQERQVREAVFLSDVIPVWLGPVGYCCLAVLGTACIPLVYPPARWYMVLVAFLLGPPVALANGFGAGLTDVDNSANYSTVAMFLFAAWAAATGGNGIVAGCVLSGVLMVFSVSAAVLLQDLRTGYITLAPPSSLLVAQVLGAAFGVLFSPLAFALFWSTGQVGRPEGPYPAPFASVTRGMASIGVDGVGALPRYCGLLSLVFFLAAFVICVVRELLPVKFGRFVPSPMGMAFPFFIPASNAIDFWLGSVIVMVWEWKSPASAAHYAPLAGAGLLVGDGLWAIPSALLAIANVSPPVCMKFE